MFFGIEKFGRVKKYKFRGNLDIIINDYYVLLKLGDYWNNGSNLGFMGYEVFKV